VGQLWINTEHAMNVHDFMFHEEIFAQTIGWTPIYSDSRFTQRCRIERGGAMFTETRLAIKAPAEVIVAKLRDEWTWWRNGRYCNRMEHPDGTIQYDHFPFGVFVHVNSVMHPPLELEPAGWRVRVEISHFMAGTMYYDAIPHGGDSTEFVSRFSGCRVSGRFRALLCPGSIAARIHLAAERGRCVWRHGTGFPGLVEELERTRSQVNH
jgi:hypothetical protein